MIVLWPSATELEASTEEARANRGKKPKPPGRVKVHKTAVFKIHNPSRHKRGMLTDSHETDAPRLHSPSCAPSPHSMMWEQTKTVGGPRV
jgi:hypothetical protein